MLNAFRWTCILALICALGTAVATVRRVPEDYLAIQTALFNASNGDTVSVKPGTPQSPTTYSDSLNFKGSDSVLVAARDSVNAGIREISNPDPEATIIDANSMSTNVVKIADPLATINQAGIRGFTLKNGQAQTGGIFGGDGGGIFVYACAEAVIEKMIIRGNSGSSDGGGICIQSLPSGASVIIDSCRITDNTATSKGGGDRLSLFFRRRRDYELHHRQ